MAGWLTDEQLRDLEAYATSGDDRELLALVVEVQAARQVVETGRNLPRTVGSTSATRVGYAEAAFDAALAKYDAGGQA
jgi:hypothetical protein